MWLSGVKCILSEQHKNFGLGDCPFGVPAKPKAIDDVHIHDASRNF